jgi:hypothetical protein
MLDCRRKDTFAMYGVFSTKASKRNIAWGLDFAGTINEKGIKEEAGGPVPRVAGGFRFSVDRPEILVFIVPLCSI